MISTTTDLFWHTLNTASSHRVALTQNHKLYIYSNKSLFKNIVLCQNAVLDKQLL